jgi:hypothetical protein
MVNHRFINPDGDSGTNHPARNSTSSRFEMKLIRPLLPLLCLAATAAAQTFVKPPEQDRNQAGAFLENNVDRPLRYHPVERDFVITNSPEFFNRPLYSANAPFRADAGDQPELSLYLPGRGGNLRFGLKTPTGTKWLHETETVIARYRPGAMLYEIRDRTLGVASLLITMLPLAQRDGVIVRVVADYLPSGTELIWAFGGANGMRGRRSGDIGCENEPVSQFFQMRPEQCENDQHSLSNHLFAVQGRSATIGGTATAGANHELGAAIHWTNLPALLASTTAAHSLSVVLGRQNLQTNTPVYLALYRLNTNHPAMLSAEDLPQVFVAAQSHRDAIANRVVVETPDPFVNTAAAALNVAADAIWDTRQTSFMHGAVAWRNRLLGWRGMYAGDALGWHERTRQHIAGFAKEQNLNPIPDQIPPADEDTNLSRSRKAVHSNGNLTKNHYDMNLVAVDALFRHLLWTGDLDFAREMWPMLERHFAWERRLFRREFGPDKLPLYEGYAAIWASDDLTYNGGGAAHASAYNYYHNKMAARVAELIGKDPTPHQREADLIRRAMQKFLWLPDHGWFAEYKDYLGLQMVHPSAALWSYYHTIDSEVPTPREAWQMTGGLDTQFARIPLRGPNVPPGSHTMPTSSWMPYTWSINNVVMAEVMHTSLAYWQANRPDGAFPLFKGALLDSMFLGLCPGNVGMCTYFDTYRRESQRDFADGVGATSRALIEGLFGIKPDALAGELTLQPGFSEDWAHARIQHPRLLFSFERQGDRETFRIEPKFATPQRVRLKPLARHAEIRSVTANGSPVTWRNNENQYGTPRIEIQLSPATHHEVVIEWNTNSAAPWLTLPKTVASLAPSSTAALDWRKPVAAPAHLETVDLTPFFNDRVSQIFSNEYRAPRSPFPSLSTPKQGIGSWCHPFDYFVVDDSGLRSVARTNQGKFPLPNGVTFATPTEPDTPNILFTSQWTNYPTEASVPLSGKAKHAYFLMAGSTSHMQSRFDNGEVVVTYQDGSTDRLALHNPTTWWPIEQDYFIDDFAFRRPEPIPPRVNLKTGAVRLLDAETFKGRGKEVPGGAATVLNLPLKPEKELKSLTVRALANEVVIGLMSVTLER